MSSESADAVFDQIDRADLSATAYRTGIRLWRLAAANGGVVHIELAQMIALCGTESEGTMRNHLCQIGKAGIIEYRTAGGVFVRFLLWDFHAQRETHHAQRENGDSDLHAQREAHHAEREKSAATSHARLGLVGRSLTITEKSKKPTYPPTSQTNPSKLEGAQQLAFELLVDSEVGVIHSIATELARKLPPQDIYRVVDKWLPEHQAEIVGVGALKHRLETLKPSNARMVNLSATFRSSELFHRHRLPDKMIADPERKQYNYVPDQEPRKRYTP
jgi:hypothetical protein